jgi:taurine dioxygenase
MTSARIGVPKAVNIGTLHNAVADYGPEEPRFILRVQVMADLDYAKLAA